jgi:hypothetical protein
MTVITDPLFYAVAIPAVMFLGLSKGGFSSVGMVATPLVAVVMGPLEIWCGSRRRRCSTSSPM